MKIRASVRLMHEMHVDIEHMPGEHVFDALSVEEQIAQLYPAIDTAWKEQGLGPKDFTIGILGYYDPQWDCYVQLTLPGGQHIAFKHVRLGDRDVQTSRPEFYSWVSDNVPLVIEVLRETFGLELPAGFIPDTANVYVDVNMGD